MLRRLARLTSSCARTSKKSGFTAERLEDRRLLSAVSGALAPALQSATQTLNASTPDADNQTPTGWLWYANVDVNFLIAQTNNGYRLADLSVAQGSPLLFNAALVQNTGTYQKTWWWYVGETVDQLSAQLTANNARMIDVDPYIDGSGQEKYAAIMVSNAGAEAKTWWWYVNETIPQISAQLNTNNARLVDVSSTVVNGTTEYSAVMISNTGADNKAWWWYVNETVPQISAQLGTNNARLVHLEPVDSTHFNVIMDASAGEKWWWYVGDTIDQLSNHAAQNGARIFDLESYIVNNQKVYAALLINNSNPLENSVGDILRNASPTATTGLYLKQVGGPVLAQLQPDKQFEPASMIKVVLHLTAMRAVAAGTAHLSDPMYMYYNPAAPYVSFNNPGNPDEHPEAYADTPSNRVQLTLGQLLEMMMERSDNRATKAIQDRFGNAAINATAQSAGMTNTVFASILGSGVPGNFLTLNDAGKLYEGVLNGSLLNSAYIPEFWRRMNDENDADREDVPFQEGIFGPFQTDATEEAANLLGLPQTDPLVMQFAAAFVANMKGSWKGGGYTIPGGTSQWDEIRTVGGYLGVPVEDSTGNTTVKDYVYGVFIDGALVPQTPYPNPQVDAVNNAWSDSQQELLRGVIHDAMTTWRVNPNLVVTNLNDSGAGSLRQAIQIADASVGTATITFAHGLSGTITLTSGGLNLDNPYCRIKIEGPGANVLTVSGNNAGRVFNETAGTFAEIFDLTISHGSSAGRAGGGINVGGSLDLWRSLVTLNNAGTAAGGGIAVVTTGQLSLFDSTVSANNAAQGAGIDEEGTMIATDSTLANNVASAQGGGVWLGTPAGNTATATLINLTISGNHAALGGGIYRANGNITLKNTIVAGNFRNATTTADDVTGTIAAASSFNLIGAGGAGGLTNGTNSNQVGVTNPGLAALGNYGGPTPTMALMFNSPAYNHGSNALILNGITTEQRGRPRIVGTAVDIGAYESQAPALAGDVDHNGSVNFADLLALAQHYGQAAVPMYELGDLNGDGQVSFADLLTLAQNYGKTGAATVAASALLKRRL